MNDPTSSSNPVKGISSVHKVLTYIRSANMLISLLLMGVAFMAFDELYVLFVQG